MTLDLTTLAAWIAQQIDLDEQWARAANQTYTYAEDTTPPADGVHWTWAAGENWEPVTPNVVTEEYVGEAFGSVSVNLVTVEQWPTRMTPSSPVHPMPQPYFGTAEEVDASFAGHVVRWDPHRVLAACAANRALLDVATHALVSDGLAEAALRAMAAQWRDAPGWLEEWAGAPTP